MRTREEKWRRKGSHSSSMSSSNCLMWLQTWKKVRGWCIPLWKMLLFCCENHHERVMQIWTSPSEEEVEEEEEEERNTFWQLSGSVLSLAF